MKKSSKLGFSLIELSVVVLVIGILVIGITKGSRILGEAKLKSARSLTTSSPVNSISGLSLWLETTLESSISNATGTTNISDGGSISSWNDINPQTSSRINVTQATAINQPQYLKNGINNLPTVYFDGANFSLSSNTGPITLRNTNYSIIAVVQTNSPTSSSWQQIIYQGGWCDGSTQGAVASLTLNPSSNIGPGLATCMNDHFPVAYKIKTRYINIGVTNGQSIRFYSNSNTPSSSTFGLTHFGPRSSALQIGHTFGVQLFNGYISEIIVFNRTLKQSEVVSINEYLSNKYSIKVN